MAYISTAEVKQIRLALKKEFPQCKFSVRQSPGYHAVHVDVLKGHVAFNENCEGKQVNHFYIDHNYDKKQAVFLKKIEEIIKTAPDGGWYDRSDSMTDYFDTAFYYVISIGQWKKPYEQIRIN